MKDSGLAARFRNRATRHLSPERVAAAADSAVKLAFLSSAGRRADSRAVPGSRCGIRGARRGAV